MISRYLYLPVLFFQPRHGTRCKKQRHLSSHLILQKNQCNPPLVVYEFNHSEATTEDER